MERASKFSLIHKSLAIIGLSFITLTHNGLQPEGAAGIKVEETPEVFLPPDLELFGWEEIGEQLGPKDLITRLDLAALINIPYFFEGCRIIDRGWAGIGSVYSEQGCVGCSKDLKMANGEIFRNQKLVFAAWRDDLNTYFLLTNFDNNLRAQGRLTDRGGFDAAANPEAHKILGPKLRNRSFDLSLGLSASLGYIRTDKTIVRFQKLDC